MWTKGTSGDRLHLIEGVTTATKTSSCTACTSKEKARAQGEYSCFYRTLEAPDE